MKNIPLSGGLVAFVDDSDFPRVAVHSWRPAFRKRQCYAYLKPVGENRIVLLHRFIMEAKPGQIIDHIDQNGLNCTRANMRFATRSQNCQNVDKINPQISTPFKGVSSYDYKLKPKVQKKWLAKIRVNNKHYHLGLFETAYDAAVAYDIAAIKYLGEFAKTNFPVDK